MNQKPDIITRFTRNAWCAFFLAALVLPVSCGKKDEEFKPGELPKQELDPKYFSKANPGKWKDVAPNHYPDVEILNIGQNKQITIRSNFPNMPGHYAEVIILADHMHREIGSVVIEKGKPAEATFTLPRDYRSKLYAIVKCNLHDMWEQPLIFD